MLKVIIPSILGIIASLMTAQRSVKTVQEGALGVKKCFGKVVRDKSGLPKIFGPGIHFVFPGVLRVEQRHVLQQSVQCAKQEVLMEDGVSFVVQAFIRFTIHDIYSALYVVSNLDATLEDQCRGIIRDILGRTNHLGFNFNGDLTELIMRELEPLAGEWGVTIESLKLMTCAPTEQSAAAFMMPVRYQALRAVATLKGCDEDTFAASALGALVAGTAVAMLPSQRLESDADGLQDLAGATDLPA